MKRDITEQIIRCILDNLENNLSRQSDAVACVQTSPLPQKKSGEEISSPDFF